MVEERNRNLEEFLKRIKENFSPCKIILFGSRARGDWLMESDYDILIVSDAFQDMDFRERIIEVYKLLDQPLNVDVICLTPGEFERRKDELSIIGKAAREGKIIE